MTVMTTLCAPPQRLDAYLGQAFDQVPMAMIVIDARGRVVRVNPLAETTFGYLPGELLGRPVECLMPERFRMRHEGHRASFLSETQGRPMGVGRELWGLRKDGREFPLEIGINPIQTEQGPMVLSVILDLTERKQSEQRIREALQQKEVLLREVHHRVKNNLQVIHSLLDLQTLKVKDPTVVAMLQDSQNRIRSMSLIHQTLYQASDVAQVDFEQFLTALMPHLMASYAPARGQVSVQMHAASIKLPINDAVPCGLIVNELVSNALKHGFPQGRSGQIEVLIDQPSPDRVELSVSNNGLPIPEELRLPPPDSLGLQLVQLLSRQLRGQLEIRRSDPIRFSLSFQPGAIA